MTGRIKLICLIPPALLCAGCAETAAVNLISVAREGIADARGAQQDQHEELMTRLAGQKESLDEAFDSDVRLVAAGGITDADGEPVELTPEWVISARAGYAAARDVVAAEMLSAELAHAARLDNLAAADEALEMATDLLLRQAGLTEPVRVKLLDKHGRWIDDRQQR